MALFENTSLHDVVYGQHFMSQEEYEYNCDLNKKFFENKNFKVYVQKKFNFYKKIFFKYKNYFKIDSPICKIKLFEYFLLCSNFINPNDNFNIFIVLKYLMRVVIKYENLTLLQLIHLQIIKNNKWLEYKNTNYCFDNHFISSEGFDKFSHLEDVVMYFQHSLIFNFRKYYFTLHNKTFIDNLFDIKFKYYYLYDKYTPVEYGENIYKYWIDDISNMIKMICLKRNFVLLRSYVEHFNNNEFDNNYINKNTLVALSNNIMFADSNMYIIDECGKYANYSCSKKEIEMFKSIIFEK